MVQKKKLYMNFTNFVYSFCSSMSQGKTTDRPCPVNLPNRHTNDRLGSVYASSLASLHPKVKPLEKSHMKVEVCITTVQLWIKK